MYPEISFSGGFRWNIDEEQIKAKKLEKFPKDNSTKLSVI